MAKQSVQYTWKSAILEVASFTNALGLMDTSTGLYYTVYRQLGADAYQAYGGYRSIRLSQRSFKKLQLGNGQWFTVRFNKSIGTWFFMQPSNAPPPR